MSLVQNIAQILKDNGELPAVARHSATQIIDRGITEVEEIAEILVYTGTLSVIQTAVAAGQIHAALPAVSTVMPDQQVDS